MSFDVLLHADWSVSPAKRWLAEAARSSSGWTLTDVRPVGSTMGFLDDALTRGEQAAVLTGFDFPIGISESFGSRTGLADFREFIAVMGTGRWSRFADVARDPDEISLERPFYPAGAAKGITQRSLIDAHGVGSIDDLRRLCEQATSTRRAACPLFWTLGGNQVGKGALTGWKEVVQPAVRRGARLWPFEGALADLGSQPGLVICETYPAEAYGHVGAKFTAAESKTRQSDRAAKAGAILRWAEANTVAVEPTVRSQIIDGFGNAADGEDRFDALLGLLGMIEVVTGRREEAAKDAFSSPWEGWIMGQTDSAGASTRSSIERPAPPTQSQSSSEAVFVDQALIDALLASDTATRNAVVSLVERGFLSRK